MVSFWPWKGDDTTATFEKTLSNLSSKISKANNKDASLRSHLRRYRALWTLYTSFIYITYTLILVLVTGYQRWGPVEYGAVTAGPVVIYGVRTGLTAYYEYRLSTNQAHLRTIQKQRTEAIEKFKTATKYNSTQQLLEKYGAEPKKSSTAESKPTPAKKKGNRESTGEQRAQPQRTNIAPPPTANIRRPADLPLQDHATPPQTGAVAGRPFSPISPQTPNGPTGIRQDVTAEFAPNADSSSQQYLPYAGGPKWYDRIMDVLLGEDETKPINRLALICSECKLVNGQAPPGVKRLEDVGKWRCSSCKAWNGEESEVKKILSEVSVTQEPQSPSEMAASTGVEDKTGEASADAAGDIDSRTAGNHRASEEQDEAEVPST